MPQRPHSAPSCTWLRAFGVAWLVARHRQYLRPVAVETRQKQVYLIPVPSSVTGAPSEPLWQSFGFGAAMAAVGRPTTMHMTTTHALKNRAALCFIVNAWSAATRAVIYSDVLCCSAHHCNAAASTSSGTR